MENKLPTISTLRRWKRDALEAHFEMDQNKNLYVRYVGMMKNFAKVCDILVDEYPHIMNFVLIHYERISNENIRLREENSNLQAANRSLQTKLRLADPEDGK